MDRKSIPIVIICLLLVFMLPRLANRIFPPKPLPPSATNQVASAVQRDTNTSEVTRTETPQLEEQPKAASASKSFSTPSNVVEQTLIITNDDARYTFTSHGGGLRRIELLHYRETISRAHRKQPLTNNFAELNAHVSVPVLAVRGDDSIEGDNLFTLTRTPTGVKAEKTLPNGLRIIKEFEPTTNYLITTTVRFENTTGQALKVPAQEWTVGTATPMGPDDNGQYVGMMWYDGRSKQEIGRGWFDNRTLGCIPGVPRTEYRAGTSNVIWVAVHNQFFALVAMPIAPAEQIVSSMLDLPRDPDESMASSQPNTPLPKGFLTSLGYPAVTIAPAQILERQIYFFAGPKEYRTLARIADRFHNEVDAVMGFDQVFPFYKLGGFFGKALLLGMNALHNAFSLSYGWAIIVITIIIKLLFWPLTAASTRSMKRMAALQPQMKALQEKYKDDPAEMNRRMMKFWKENKVNPMGGCLPMLLQMPVFFGFFTMIRTAIELRGASWLWVLDLSKPDTLFMIPGVNFPFNLLPLLMGATMLWQSHLTPPSPGMDPTQQKMMRYMPLIFLVFLYNFSSGLTLYWTVQNLLTILQTKLTKTMSPAVALQPSVLTPHSKKKK